MPRLIVRAPSPSLADGELTHLERVGVDAGRALSQWHDYVSVFRERGWDITEAAAADDHPDGVFVEDGAVAFDDLVVVTRPGSPRRRGEVASLRDAVAAASPPPAVVATITEPGTLDGGDVLKVGRTVYVGRSSRTNDAGVAQLAAVLQPRGWTVRVVPVTRVLHLKSSVTALPDGTVIGYPPLVDDPDLFARFLPVPEPHGTAVVVLGDDTVLMSADAPETAALLGSRGLTVVTTPVTEFEKLEGCVTCLSIRLRR